MNKNLILFCLVVIGIIIIYILYNILDWLPIERTNTNFTEIYKKRKAERERQIADEKKQQGEEDWWL